MPKIKHLSKLKPDVDILYPLTDAAACSFTKTATAEISVCTPMRELLLVVARGHPKPSPLLSLSRPLFLSPLRPTALLPLSSRRPLLHNPHPSFRQGCMGDPDFDHGFMFDDQGRTDILGSPSFDVYFRTEETVDDYVDRILYQLTLSIEQHIPPGRWYIVNCPPPSPDSATSPATTTLGFLLLSVALLPSIPTLEAHLVLVVVASRKDYINSMSLVASSGLHQVSVPCSCNDSEVPVGSERERKKKISSQIGGITEVEDKLKITYCQVRFASNKFSEKGYLAIQNARLRGKCKESNQVKRYERQLYATLPPRRIQRQRRNRLSHSARAAEERRGLKTPSPLRRPVSLFVLSDDLEWRYALVSRPRTGDGRREVDV
ncbi:hypothetical protein M5K25_014685 [Dendrobium thyrsiflorum]|uniref:Uncharacterized protein n=1 Tax=Dendrobium thyrsiflorum TaxID=117978 RepID=A0ABD0UNE9_DENTH